LTDKGTDDRQVWSTRHAIDVYSIAVARQKLRNISYNPKNFDNSCSTLFATTLKAGEWKIKWRPSHTGKTIII